jgi:beta-lactamase regulating signal transducer with metallopeptidase domain
MWGCVLQAQFGVCMVYAVRSIYIGCPFPLWMQYTSLLYGASIIALFLNFYYQAYLKQDRAKVAAAKALSSSSSSSSSSNDRVSSASSKVYRHPHVSRIGWQGA